jgi:AraC-like DNA-binding protein
VRLNVSRVAGVIADSFAARASTSARSTLHAQHGAGVFVALEADVAIAAADGTRAVGRVVIVPPDVAHTVDSPAPSLGVLFDPERLPLLAGFARQRGAPFVLDGALAQRIHGAVRAERSSLFSAGTLDGLAREIAARLVGPAARPDRRVAAAVEALRDASRDAAVDATKISPAHLRELFRRDVGISMRTFRLWRRLMLALAAYSASGDATGAAHAAGFADLAHFSRTCRRMLGYSPSLLRGPPVARVGVSPTAPPRPPA